MFLPADSSCEGRVSLHFTQPGLSMPAAEGVVDEKGSKYILAHTEPRELDGHPLGECGSSYLLHAPPRPHTYSDTDTSPLHVTTLHHTLTLSTRHVSELCRILLSFIFSASLLFSPFCQISVFKDQELALHMYKKLKKKKITGLRPAPLLKGLRPSHPPRWVLNV